MPSKKKSRGKRGRKAKTSKDRAGSQSDHITAEVESLRDVLGIIDNDDVGEIADSLREVDISAEEMMASMHERLVSSLGEGYDAGSLKLLDHKHCDYFLSRDSIYYDDGRRKKSPNPVKPTNEEMKHYKMSEMIRRRILRKANGIMQTNNFLAGQAHKNLELYEEFYEDLMMYHYAWFEIIFKDGNRELLLACNTLVKLASVKLDKGEKVDKLHEIVNVLRELKDLFQSSVTEEDVEGCDDAGYIEYDFYDICYKMAVQMAMANREDEAEEYFDMACTAENVWGYFEEENRHCGKVLEYAVGKRLTRNDLADIEDYAMDNGGFYYKCLQAHINRKRGSVSWKSTGVYTDLSDEEDSEEDVDLCDNCGIPSSFLLEKAGKKLLRCTRCKIALYCSKDCQVEAWKNGHKRECGST